MARDTPRFGLDDYAVGDTNWDHSDLVRFVDEHSIERGPVADRPTQGTYPDELYLATDERVLYRWDADAATWLVAIRAGLSPGEDFDGQGTASFSNLQSMDAGVVRTPERDGTIEIGAGESIQAAIDAGADEVHVRPDYDESVESLPVIVDQEMTIRGPGYGSPLDFQGETGVSVFQLSDVGSATNRRTLLSNLHLQGGQYGVELTDAAHVSLQSIWVEQAAEDGFIASEDDGTSYGNKFFDCAAYECGRNGFNILGQNAFHTGSAYSFHGCVAEDNTNIGLYHQSGRGVSVHGLWSERNGNEGLRSDAGTIHVYGGYMEANDGTEGNQLGVRGSERASIRGVTIDGSGTAGTTAMILQNCEKPSVADCEVANYDTRLVWVQESVTGARVDADTILDLTGTATNIVDDAGTGTSTSGWV